MAAVDFLLKYWFLLMLTMLLVITTAVLYQYSQKHDFQFFVNNEIERAGGLTPAALEEIENYSSEHYNGRFKMLTGPISVSHGEVIEYKYSLTITPLFWDLDVISKEFSGKASSKVR